MGQLTHVQELASPLVEKSALREIRLFESHGRHIKFPNPSNQLELADLAVHISVTHEPGSSSAIYLMHVDTSVEEIPEPDELSGKAQPEAVVDFTVVYGALYSLELEDLEIADGAVEAFGQCVAALALWPYIRSEIARLSEAMHVPPVTLPMLTQQDIAELV